MPKVNEQVGDYTLIRRIGKGSYGQVWLAEDQTGFVTTQVAIKFIEDYEDAQFELVEREAKVWAEASGHPNILPIMKAKKYDDKVIFISEYLKEGSLQDWLKANKGKAPSEESAVKIMLGVLSGLEHLHSKRIVHRDLKPANILLQNGTPKLADFGLSRVLKTINNSNTGISGTSVYISPETYRGKRTEQVDIWAAGVIFYQLLAGKLPFPEEELFILMRIVNEESPKPLPETVSNHLQEIVFHALEKDLAKRFQSATEMKVALELILARLSIATAPLQPGQPVVEIVKPNKPEAPEVEPKIIPTIPLIPPTEKVPPAKLVKPVEPGVRISIPPIIPPTKKVFPPKLVEPGVRISIPPIEVLLTPALVGFLSFAVLNRLNFSPTEVVIILVIVMVGSFFAAWRWLA